MTAIGPREETLAAYRIDETYDWNYAHPPAVPSAVPANPSGPTKAMS